MNLANIDFKIKLVFFTFIVTVILGLIIIPILRKLKVGQMERAERT